MRMGIEKRNIVGHRAIKSSMSEGYGGNCSAELELRGDIISAIRAGRRCNPLRFLIQHQRSNRIGRTERGRCDYRPHFEGPPDEDVVIDHINQKQDAK